MTKEAGASVHHCGWPRRWCLGGARARARARGAGTPLRRQTPMKCCRASGARERAPPLAMTFVWPEDDHGRGERPSCRGPYNAKQHKRLRRAGLRGSPYRARVANPKYPRRRAKQATAGGSRVSCHRPGRLHDGETRTWAREDVAGE